MARATTKLELLSAGEDQFKKLWNMIDSLTDEEQRGEFNYNKESLGKEAHWKRDKNIRDVLIHLYEWHQLLLNWVKTNENGETKPFLPEPYNWKSYGDMNVEFWKKHQNTSYEEAVKMVEQSHKDVMALTDKYTNEELFTKKYFSWTGTTNLGAYFVSAVPSHYDWAMKKIKLYIKQLNK